jgi:hypothetical protein
MLNGPYSSKLDWDADPFSVHLFPLIIASLPFWNTTMQQYITYFYGIVTSTIEVS